MRLFVIPLLLLALCAAQAHCKEESGPETLPPVPPSVIPTDLSKDVKCVEAEEAAPLPPQFWGSADFWVAWIRGVTFPTLVTVGPASDPIPGALNQNGTTVRFGGDQTPHERLGARFEFGAWFDDANSFGLQAGGAFLASRSVGSHDSSPGTPVLARPFYDVDGQQQNASLASFPGTASGTIDVHSGTRLYNVDANGVMVPVSNPVYAVRLLAGFRYFDLHDDLAIAENVLVSPVAMVPTAGQNIGVRDNFACDNCFYGGNLGFSATYDMRLFELVVKAQCALGMTQECVNIAGATRIDGGPVIPAGLLAVSSNSGGHERNAFAVLPELEVDARFEVSRHVVVSAGYSVLYWSNVARAGQQVDTNVNLNLVPTSTTYGQAGGPSQPQASIHDTYFWAQGIHFGLELRF